ncbi:unnamed protein product [Paramecium pentaurelia]|uniref:Uncharacterized protein n=1 Tax=Paramecium pentaurelia TaxID=43138 RepID=A0A8S1T2D3_9CILI|nr:unnamed protein product [Paramecium pentaurelia]
MRRYDRQNERQKEIKLSDNQKFLSFSLEAPSKQLKFMPNTYPGLPSYYQTPYDDYLRCFKQKDETIEIQDLINQNEEKHEMNTFLQSFRLKNGPKKGMGVGMSRQMFSGLSIIKPGNLSSNQDMINGTLRSMNGGELSSIAHDGPQNQSLIRVEENILNIFNMKEEVDKVYKKLIN